MKRVWMNGEWLKRAGVLGILGVTGALGLVVVGAGARSLEDHVGLRNTVYTLVSAALLVAVFVEAVHHRLVRDHAGSGEVSSTGHGAWMLNDPAWNMRPAAGGADSSDPMLRELHLAARLGAELMGEVPASRTVDGPISSLP